MPSPSGDVVKNKLREVWKIGAVISVGGLLYVIGSLVVMLFKCTSGDNNCVALYLTPGVKIVYAIWTVAVPFWFFAEWVYVVDWKVAIKPESKPALDYMKGCQDQARAIWAGFAAVAGILLLKYG